MTKDIHSSKLFTTTEAPCSRTGGGAGFVRRNRLLRTATAHQSDSSELMLCLARQVAILISNDVYMLMAVVPDGIYSAKSAKKIWIPAFAGMTV
ncbi:hypothetical protein [Desulfonatronum parangueonense]